ncbi:hypothetical protein MCUN1_001014 [Malassezia cuniculi]|uniref:EF-hand domain-containing protein n=1 Tax=Malassezia cuniculi TaxID=948313 RepID=A0AAF0EWS2_9BASI|nr:hypothetical protein MCUN1_001014 [Malassezia cuniculi]
MSDTRLGAEPGWVPNTSPARAISAAEGVQRDARQVRIVAPEPDTNTLGLNVAVHSVGEQPETGGVASEHDASALPHTVPHTQLGSLPPPECYPQVPSEKGPAVQTPPAIPTDRPGAPGEPDDYFDWLAENDVDEKNRTTEQGDKKLRLRNLSSRKAAILLFTTFLGNLILVGVFLIPILVVRFVYRKKGGDQARRDFVADNIEAWFIWVVFNIHFQWWIHFLVELFPAAVLGLIRLVWGSPAQVALIYAEYYGVNKLYIKLVFYGALNWGSWAIIFNSCYDLYSRTDPSQNSRAPYTTRIYQVMEFIFFLLLTFCAEKIIIRLIAMRFHKTAYADRIQQVTHILKTLDYLYDHRPKRTIPIRNRGFNASHDSPRAAGVNLEAPQQRVRMRSRIAAAGIRTKNKLKSSSQYAAMLASVAMRDPAQLLRAEEIGVSLDLTSSSMAKLLAKDIFESYRGTSKRPYLVPSDFAVSFPTLDAANQAFAVFDSDGNGDVSQSEIKNTVMFAYKERRALAHAMHDVNHAVKSLDMILSIIAAVFVLFEALQIFNFNISQSIATFYSLGIAFAFIFKDSAQAIFDSIIFLFVTHPFDTGDLVNVNGDPVFVKKLSLLFSQFVTTTGLVMCVSNSVLATQRITNYRRSERQFEETHLQFAYDTPLEKLDAVMEDLNNWIAADEEHRFIYPSRMIWQKLEYSRIIDVTVGMLHSHNFQDWGDRLHRQAAFFAALSYYLRKHGVMFEHGLQTAQMHDQDYAAEYEAAAKASDDPDSFEEGALPHKFAMHSRDIPRAAKSTHVTFQHPEWVLNTFGMQPDPSFDAPVNATEAPSAAAGGKRFMYFAPPRTNSTLRLRQNAVATHTAGS